MKSEVSIKARLGLILFGVIAGLVICEVALEFMKRGKSGSEFENLAELRSAMLRPEAETGEVSLKSLVSPHPDDKIIYELRPNLDLTFQRARVRTNSCGMRDSERSVAKPPGTYRIALLGDSFAFAWGVEEQQGFAKILEKNLNRISAGRPKFEILNFGVPGYSTFQEVASFREKGLDFNPDEVLVYFVDNDFGLPFFVRDVYQPGGMLAATEFARLAWRAVDPKIESQKLALTGYDANRALQELSALARERGMRLSLAINPRKNWKSEVRKNLWALRQDRSIRHIALRDQLMHSVEVRGLKSEDLTLSFDPHPSPVKHRLLGDLLTPYFMDVIE